MSFMISEAARESYRQELKLIQSESNVSSTTDKSEDVMDQESDSQEEHTTDNHSIYHVPLVSEK